VAAAAAIVTGAVGGTVTDVGPWYQGLAKPAWKPPDLAFPVIWTLIFALSAIAGVTAWLRTRTRSEREWIIALFAFNGFLNILWSLLFFRLHRLDWAFIEAFALWGSVAALMAFLFRISRTASLLLLPYLIWVTTAAVLNHALIALNPVLA